MRLFGFLLLLAGWALVLCAVVLFVDKSAPRATFVLAGMGVEIAGLVMVIRAHALGHRGTHE